MMNSNDILIMEDSQSVMEGILDICKYLGYNSLGETRFTEDLYEKLKKEHFDLLIIDIMLSGHDGRDLTKRFKNTAEIKDTPIILMSAFTYLNNSVKASGADDFLQKPFSLEELQEKIEPYLKTTS